MTEDFAVIPTAERYRIYIDIAAVAVDFAPGTDEYIAANTFFSQSPRPTRLMIASVDTGSETYVDAIADAQAKNRFYALALTNLALVDATILLIAAYVQTQIMLFFFQTSSLDVLTTGTTDIVSQLKAVNSDRTVPCWESTGSERFDMAYAGMGLTRPVGSFNWAYQVLTGVTPTSATASEQINGIGKGANFYTLIASTPLTREGNTAGNPVSYIDQIQGIDYMTINIQQEVFQLIAELPKVPYTDAGVAALMGATMNVLRAAQRLNILDDETSIDISALPVAQVPAAQRAARIAPDINFTARLAGAINFVTINGVVAV
jgi:hypothetical protein